MDMYSNYLQLKRRISTMYKNYPLDKILSIKIASIAYKKTTLNFKDVIRLFRIKNIAIHQNESKASIFSIGTYGRDDYYQLLDYVEKNTPSITIDLYKTKYKYVVNLYNIYFSFREVFSAYHEAKLSFIDKISLSIDMTSVINTIEHLEKIDLKAEKVKNFCSFCSNLTGEAELNYFFKNRGVETYTLQHGLWFIYPTPQPIDALVYENLLADKILCWGQYTKDEFTRVGIPPDSLLIGGYPRQHSSVLKPKGKVSKKILILLARNTYDKNNEQLLNVASALVPEYEVEYKLHPSLAKEKYEKICNAKHIMPVRNKTVSELIAQENYICTITYNTTAYYDSYVNNCPALRFIDKDADNSISVMDDSFTTSDELKAHLVRLSVDITSDNYWERVSERLLYILGFGIDNYNYFLEGKNEDN
ncbi:hypothetical protein M979_1981 [Buttiauxella noackiae ATCC 51607]|uniref:Uncharacterized protein n=1 Tax=Buttiauxella noackiae ATCC 51607 TaxID=1354255 RepID=A0A1B7HQF0_9ENTR|nr:hypothetical protein [Buttiauxella noackiae]OAT17838.1 hypothetical protein M979_1981 [Buttiauxella noackiae ATCC 51607]